MKFNISFFGLFLVKVSLGSSTVQINSFISSFYSNSHISGLYVYLCENEDYLFINSPNEIGLNTTKRISVLNESNVKRGVDENLLKEIRFIGIYVDITCADGEKFVEQSALERKLFSDNYKWLLKSDSYEASASLLNNLKISIDSDVSLAVHYNDSFLVYEIFKIHESLGIESYPMAHFNPNMERSSTGIKPNREDLKGFVMNVTFVILQNHLTADQPVEILLDPFFNPELDRYSRFSYLLFIHVSEVLNFTYNYLILRDWGVEDASGNWSGLLGYLQRGEREFSLQFSNARKDRLNVVDIKDSYHQTGAIFLFFQPRTFGTYKALVVPFSSTVWICFGLISVILPFVYGFIAKYDESSRSNDLSSWSSIFIYLAGAIAQQGFPESTQGLISTKVASSFLLMFTFILCLYYNAAVLNGLLSPSLPTITSLESLINSNFKLGVADLPYMRDFDSEESVVGYHDDLTTKMIKKLFHYDRMFYGLEEGLEEVKKGKFAFFAVDDGILPLVTNTFSEAEICSTHILIKPPKMNVGLTFKKNSPYKEMIRNKFSWMREVGLFKRNLDIWYPGLPKCTWRQQAIPIGSEAVSIAFLVLIIGYVLSLLIFIAEFYIKPETVMKFNIF